MMNKKLLYSGPIFFLIMVFCPFQSAWSMQVTNSLRIDGFGMQGYVITSRNNYFGADPQGSFNFNAFNMVIKANVNDHFNVWAKLLADAFDTQDMVVAEWAFGEYIVNNQLQFRAGKIKMPLGVYSEIGGIYPILPLSTLPELYLDDANFLPDHLKGLSLTGRFFKKTLKLSYDIYMGRTGGDIDSKGKVQVEDMIGSRVLFLSREENLKLGLNYFHGMVPSTLPMAHLGMSHYQISLEYRYYIDLALRGEWALHEDDTGSAKVGYYLELTYLIDDLWMPVIRYDVFFPVRGNDTLITDYQKDLVLGLNYRFSDYLGWKGEAHFIKGTALLDSGMNPSPQGDWNLFITSITFLF